MLSLIRSGAPLSFKQRLVLTAKLSWPAIMAQLSNILMQYIDAAMVGHLGADDSAAVGLVSTSLWLFWGICSAATVGFSVQVAHRLGGSDETGAKRVLRQGITTSFLFGLVVGIVGVVISPFLPEWLGGTESVNPKASLYFLVFVGALPLLTLNYLGGAMLRASGNMKVPSALNIMMCLLDVVLNVFLIFPSRDITLGSLSFTLPGAGLGVLGAAIGTAGAETFTALCMMWYTCYRQKELAIFGKIAKGALNRVKDFVPSRDIVRNAFRVSAPMTLEHAVICGAQIMVTVIVAPLGVVAIAANAFAVTAEALCYMPGYGIADAATTIVGNCYGAGRKKLAKQFGYMTVGLGMIVMTAMGVIMWITAPLIMDMLTPVKGISELGASALRIESWAEPMFAASIVAYGVMVGVGDTLVPSIMNFSSIWLVRIPLAAILAPMWGVDGVWTAMCIELCFRGSIFLYRLFRGTWLKHGLKNQPNEGVGMPQIDPNA